MADRESESPLVSVVIPTHYRNDVLVETVRSVLAQSYSPIETIVVDDSGEGHAAPVVERFDEVDYVAFDENRGANAARTAGARRARGRYVHFLDDDDRMFDSKVERQVRRFEEVDGTGVVYTGLRKKGDQTDLPDPDVQGDVLKAALTFDMWPCMTSTMLIDSDVLAAVLPLSDRAAAQDLELMIQLARRTAFEFVDAPLLYKRIDMDSLGSSMTAVDCRRQLVIDYADLYAEHPPRIRKTAMAKNYEAEAALLLRKRGWSTGAIGSLLRHCYYVPDQRLQSVVKVLAGCFGKPGWTALDRVNRLITAVTVL